MSASCRRQRPTRTTEGLASRAYRANDALDGHVERLVLPLPLVGPVLRANLAARWCDAVRLGTQAGLDLPTAIGLAQDATRSGRLAKDGKAMTEGQSVTPAAAPS